MNVTLVQVAAVILRISGVVWLWDALVALTSLPGDIYGMTALQPGYLLSQRELGLAMLVVRIGLYLIIGSAFLFFASPLAKIFTKGLEHGA